MIPVELAFTFGLLAFGIWLGRASKFADLEMELKISGLRIEELESRKCDCKSRLGEMLHTEN